jgi:hypothetical protein
MDRGNLLANFRTLVPKSRNDGMEEEYSNEVRVKKKRQKA